MKLWSKEALVLGGIYGVLSAPLTYLDLDNISMIVFAIFILCILMLCFSKTPKFLDKIIKNHPKIAYYLASIGWVPYFVIIGIVGFIALGCFIEYSDNVIKILMNLYVWILDLGVPVSFVIAFIRQKLH